MWGWFFYTIYFKTVTQGNIFFLDDSLFSQSSRLQSVSIFIKMHQTTIVAQICLYFVKFHVVLLFCATIMKFWKWLLKIVFCFLSSCPDDEIQRRKIQKFMSKKKWDTASQKILKFHFCPVFGLISTILSTKSL